ncbi:DedA family protein [Tessaracoccus sp. ZS01]|uniref:DedA family protein n=1 Tax=Tessaracoccus sp. ZS01 TaxID=1906324 RepID=UPI001E2FF9F7|nr:VTT domain-containing protein [Tessaracoccus sp. ZS01]
MFDPTTWDAPFAVVVVALFGIVMLRANATYWLGRGIAAGARRTRLVKLMESRHYATGARWLNRWGAPAVSISFLTIGIQTMVNLAAGVTRMPLRRYLPAVTLGCIMWAFLYGTIGMIGFKAIGILWTRSPWLVLAVALVAAALVTWIVRRRDVAPDAATH